MVSRRTTTILAVLPFSVAILAWVGLFQCRWYAGGRTHGPYGPTNFTLTALQTQAIISDAVPPAKPTDRLVPLLKIGTLGPNEVMLPTADPQSGRVFDAWGNPIWVRRTPSSGSGWVFLSNGANGVYDGGLGDDIVQPWPPALE
ncbi:MAG: hypothetical protein JSU86_04905 [Phycisphaerales bacterium]|nr:MAG: hypothetical protein JSU86_04905 [Phycisphaerales bacterium]